MITLSLPAGSGFGWGTCGTHLSEAFHRLTLTRTITSDWDKDDYPFDMDGPLLQAIQGVNLMPLRRHLRSTTRNVGVAFIEDSILVNRYRLNAERHFDHIVGGSSWCERILRDAGLKSVSAFVQGVDTELFKPGEPVFDPGDNFIVYSGGKFEFRKGQDIVIRAVAVMMERHADVRFMCHWHNPWPTTMDSMGASKLIKYQGERRLQALLVESRIPSSKFGGSVEDPWPHDDLPRWYNQCHVGLFPNRCEAGTNLVMMEFMACGKPVIATYAHGHADVLGSTALNLHGQKEFVHVDQSGVPRGVWYEPDLDEVVERLEWAYQNREALPEFGQECRSHMLKFTWEKAAKQLLHVCMQTANRYVCMQT